MVKRHTGERRAFRGPGRSKGFRLAIGIVMAAAAAMALACAGPAAAQPVVAPVINNILPGQGPVGTPVLITGENFGVSAPLSKVTFNGVTATTTVWTSTFITTSVPEGATTGPVVVTVLGLFQSNAVDFEVTGTPTPVLQTWYLTEGSTAWGFETFILIENTADVDATVGVVYNTQQFGRIPRVLPITVAPSSRVTLRVNDDITNVDVSTVLTSSQPIVAERSVYWNNRIEGTDSIGVTAPSTTWHLAEGCTAHGFDTWVLVQNPQIVPATIDITYMTSKGVVQKQPFTLGAGQRASVQAVKDVGACDVSTTVESNLPVVCERAMYWDGRRGGHDSIGVTEGSKKWYLAEGTTAWGFETWLLIANPTDKTANVDVTYMTSSGPVVEPRFQMSPLSRKTILVNDTVSNMDTSIEVLSNRAVIAERAMYWNNGTGKAGHDTVGLPAPARSVFLAEGSTAWGFDTYLCVQNPGDEAAQVAVVYMTGQGAAAGPNLLVPPKSRVTVYVNDDVSNMDVSMKVFSATPVMAERAMYWNARGGGHVSIGFAE